MFSCGFFGMVSVLQSSVRFLGIRRQESYLRRMNNLDPQSGQAFRHIHRLAHTPGNVGAHVSEAAIESIKHPALYPFAKENLVIRVVLAIARRTQDQPLQHKMEEVLDDFHIASGAFVDKLSLSESQNRYRQRQAEQKQRTAALPRPQRPDRTSEEYGYIQQFITSMRESIQKIRERKS